MKISSSFNTMNRKSSYQSFKGPLPPPPAKFLPKIAGDVATWVGSFVSTPEQKLFLATTALCFRPLIDLKYAEEDKKVDTAIKSASKAIAGGLTGVIIRAACISFTKKTVLLGNRDAAKAASLIPGKIIDAMSRRFIPQKAKLDFVEDKIGTIHKMDKYRETLGSVFAMAIMLLFTNKHIDVPITGFLQDFISGIVKDNKSWIRSLSDEYEKRKENLKQKITNIKNKILNIKNKLEKVIKVVIEKEESGVKK